MERRVRRNAHSLFDHHQHGPALQLLEAVGECPVYMICAAIGVSRFSMDMIVRRYERYGVLSSRVVAAGKLLRLVSLNKKYPAYRELRALLHTLNHFAPKYEAMARAIKERSASWRRGRVLRRFKDPGEGA